MKNKRIKVAISLALIAVVVVIVRCTSVPITGRKQLLLMPESSMMAMSFSQYDEFLKETKISSDKKNTDLVKNVGKRIAAAVEQYMSEKGMSSHLEGYSWEFNLVDDSTPNAWCMPGGKVVFYTGILPFCQDENGIAVVMGHEIAHAVARHGNERMSQQMVSQFGAEIGSALLSEKSAETQALFSTLYGVGSQVLVALPYSRSHETEADKLGLIFMAMAGYNPETAVAFWQRMAASGNASTPEFLSTHPSDQTRVANLQKFMPEALQYYRK
jgi:predicted Zn-dependent protease